MPKFLSCFRQLIYSEGVNPLPAKLIACIYFLMLFNAMVTTSVFPYLPKLVKNIAGGNVTAEENEENAGKKVGLIASSMFVGRVLFSFFWGYMADTKGRKKVLLATATCLASATLGFGFTFTFNWAVVARFLQGCSMGIIVISKSIVSSECDETNASLGMAIIIGATSTGMIIGPSVGGFLAFPGDLYPSVFGPDSIFTRFGILLPSTVLFVGMSTCILIALCVIPRDKKISKGTEKECLIQVENPKKYAEEQSYRSREDGSISSIAADYTDGSYNEYSRQHGGSYASVTDYNSNHGGSYRSMSQMSRQHAGSYASVRDYARYHSKSLASVNDYLAYSITTTPLIDQRLDIYEIVDPIDGTVVSNKCCDLKNSKLATLLRTKNCVLASILYGIYSFIGIGIDELFPLYAATDKEHHGFGFSTSKISLALMCAAAINLVLQFVLLPRVVRYFGPRKVFIGAAILQALFFPLVPLVEMVHEKELFWAAMLSSLFIIQFARSSAFLTVNILLNNSVEPHLLGSANGLGITVGTIGRVLSPTVMGNLFAWSLTNVKTRTHPNAIGFPLNYFFPFFILSLLAILASIFVIFFPISMDKRRDYVVNEVNINGADNENKRYLTERILSKKPLM